MENNLIMYAQLNDNNIVVAISELREKDDRPNMVAIDEYDPTLLGHLYRDGKFIPMTYYAKLDGDIVIDNMCHESDKAKPRSAAWQNTVKLDNTLGVPIGAKYVNGQFILSGSQEEMALRMDGLEDKLTAILKAIKAN